MNHFVYCDPKLCIGCGMCERRCIMAHEHISIKEVKLDDSLQRQRCKVHKTLANVAVHCRHCENAPCKAACPVGAIVHRDDNMIYVKEKECIGCKACILACPFGAIYLGDMADGRKVATKCDLCRDVADTPQCVAGCPKKALTLYTEDAIKALILSKNIAERGN